MRWFVALTCAAMSSNCGDGCRGTTKQPTTAPEHSPVKQGRPEMSGAAYMRVGSPAFHVEIARVYERFHDPQTAIDHLLKAVAQAEDGQQRALAYSALARLKQDSGDPNGAIEALERARSDIEKPGPTGAPPKFVPNGPLWRFADDNVHLRLARLYAERGDYERAQSICQSGLAAASAPRQREQFYRLEVELLRKAGTLEEKLGEAEKTLEAKMPDEPGLNLLAAALAVDGMGPFSSVGMPPAMSSGVARSAPQGIQGNSPKLVRAYERLHELHPDDLQLQQKLQWALERAGRIDEAAKLAGTSRGAVSPMHCSDPSPLQGSAAVQRAADAIRIRIRGRQADKALAETKHLAALSRQEGIAALLVAADLFLEQHADKRAGEAIRQAAGAARSQEDRRKVAYAREHVLRRGGHLAELKALRDEWRASDDPCLRQAATRGEPQRGLMPANPMVPTPADPAPDKRF
jgi:tetratricopeptide (TPR) repeat protein